jgi:hypothetical protein
MHRIQRRAAHAFALLLLASCTHAHPKITASPTLSSSPSASATVAIAWINAPPPAPTRTPSQRGIRRCVATDLAGSYFDTGAAAGNVANYIAVRNTSRTDCFVKGRPHLRLFTTSGIAFPWSAGTTFFPDEGAIEVLLKTRTRATSVESGIPDGEAQLGFSYFDCDPRDVIARAVALFGGRTFATQFRGGQIVASGNAACNGSTVQTGPVQTSVNNFEPPPAPPSPLQDARASIDAPDHVVAGTVLHYDVNVANTGSVPLTLGRSCPGYLESLGDRRVAARESYALNCAGVSISVGNLATFAMELRVPAGFRGHMNLAWWFLPKQSVEPDASAQTLITAP